MAVLANPSLPDLVPAAPARRPGQEPLPGYALERPLGRGGFGEVWRCRTPDGSHKAIKFVYGNLNDCAADSAHAEQELKALQRLKGIRHPHLLAIEAVEVVDGQPVAVLELADKNLDDVRKDCLALGQPGVPRDELLAYLLQAAEGLDELNLRHGLAHLDVKPSNLFLAGGCVKVGDYGLVCGLAAGPGGEASSSGPGGLSPVYAAPETFRGRLSRQSDQYSLAVVYQELLTGQLPFNGKNARQLAWQHQRAVPDTSMLSVGDRAALMRALAKGPAERFPSCAEFVQTLLANQAVFAQTGVLRPEPPSAGSPARPLPGFPPFLPLPGLIPAPTKALLQASLNDLPSFKAPPADQVIAALVDTAAGAARVQEFAGSRCLLRSGNTLVHHCSGLVAAADLPARLAGVLSQWTAESFHVTPGACGFVVGAPASPGDARRASLKVDVRLAGPRAGPGGLARITVQVRPFGCTWAEGEHLLREAVPRLLEDLRGAVGAVEERRDRERIPWSGPLRVCPVLPDVRLAAPLDAEVQDVSLGGIGFVLAARPDWSQAYVQTPLCTPVASVALLANLVRLVPRPDGRFEAGAAFAAGNTG